MKNEFDDLAHVPRSDAFTTLWAFATKGTPISEVVTLDQYGEECFVLSSSDARSPHAKGSASLACETALWTFRLERQRYYIWIVKEKLLYRIARSTNIRLWQKRREDGFAAGLSASLIAGIVTEKNFIMGYVGDGCAYWYQNGEVTPIAAAKGDRQKVAAMRLGVERYGIQIATKSLVMYDGDTAVFVSPHLIPHINLAVVKTYLAGKTQTNEELQIIANDLLRKLAGGQSDGTYGLALIRRIKTRS